MKVIGVHTGNGMAIHPFGKHVVGSIESRACFHSKDERQWRENFDWAFFSRTIVPGLKPDVIVTNPDCGHSSIFRLSRAKVKSDSRDNESLTLSIKAILEYKPKFFLFENLEGFLKTYKKKNFKKVFEKDYRLIFHCGSVSDFGNSQIHRKRIIIIGIRKDAPLRAKTILKKIYPVSKIRKTKRLLKGLGKEDATIGHIREHIDSPLTIYAGKKMTLRDCRDWWLENPTKKRWVVTDRKFTSAPGVYRNTHDCYPATARKQNRQFNPKGLQMTPRELARIQGVPDSFKIYIDTKQAQYWINKGRVTIAKSAPYEVGLWFYKRLTKISKLWPEYLSTKPNA